MAEQTKPHSVESEPAQGSYILQAKLTPATMGFEVQKGKAGRHVCGTIIGTANGVAARKLPNGEDSIAITGKFEGVNADTGEVFRSGVMFFPTGIQEYVLKALDDNADAEVHFAVELATKPSKSPAGYQWEVRPIVDLSLADPMSALRLAVKQSRERGQNILPAPVQPEVRKIAAGGTTGVIENAAAQAGVSPAKK